MNSRMYENSNHSGGFLLGLVAGSALGAGVACYFLAPRVVSDLRQTAADSANDLRDAASEGLQNVASRVGDVVDRAADITDDVIRRSQAVRNDVADAVARGAHEVARGAKEIARGAREVEQFATASKSDSKTAKA